MTTMKPNAWGDLELRMREDDIVAVVPSIAHAGSTEKAGGNGAKEAGGNGAKEAGEKSRDSKTRSEVGSDGNMMR
jgi:hypothetical protein